MKKYPFKFLKPYGPADRDMFFGRDEEIDALYKMVFQHSILLVYGASGTGKTSLIQCGLAGRFKSYDWLALTVRRADNINQSLEKVLTEAKGHTEPDDDDAPSDNKKALTGIPLLISNVYIRHFKPIYLIFDQFEELYILGNKKEENEFIKTIQEILSVELPVKLIFSIREEYLCQLYEFEKSVPQLMRKKLRVEPMTIAHITNIIEGINNNKLLNVSFQKDEITDIVDGILDRLKGKNRAFTIQLPYLQIFFDSLYLKITGDKNYKTDAVVTKADIMAMPEISNLLGNFLEEQVKDISLQKDKNGMPLGTDTVWKILWPFATLEGTKEPLKKNQLAEKLPGTDATTIEVCLSEFFSRSILHYVDNSDRIELMHDSLAKYIAGKRSPHDIELLEIRRMIDQQMNISEETQDLFTDKQLARIKPYLHELKLSSDENELLRKSYEIKREKLQQNIFKVAGILAAIVLLTLLLKRNYDHKRDALVLQQKEKSRVESLNRFKDLGTNEFKQENYLLGYLYMVEALSLANPDEQNQLLKQAKRPKRVPVFSLKTIIPADTTVVWACFAPGDTSIYAWTSSGFLNEFSLFNGAKLRSLNTNIPLGFRNKDNLITIYNAGIFASADKGQNESTHIRISDSSIFYKKRYIDSVVADKDITDLPKFPSVILSIDGATMSNDKNLIITWGRNTESIYSAMNLWTDEGFTVGPSLIHDGITGAAFDRNKKMILSWSNDNLRVWSQDTDTAFYKLPDELLKLKAKINTGVETVAENFSIRPIHPKVYDSLKETFKMRYAEFVSSSAK